MASTLLVLLALSATAAAALASTAPPTPAHPSPEPALADTFAGGRRLAVTSTPAGSNIFVGGVEVSRHDLFNDVSRISVHGLGGVVIPGSDKMLLEAIAVLRYGGYDTLAVAMEGLESDLVVLHNMTVFALDDDSVLSRGEGYVIVPDQLLKHADLVRLPEGTVLPTMDNELVRRLVVTRSGATEAQLLQINGVSIKAPDVFCNAMIVVHGITVPFSEAAAAEEDLQFVRFLFYLFMVGLLLIVMVLVAVIKAPRGSRLARYQECLESCCRGLRYGRRYHIVRN